MAIKKDEHPQLRVSVWPHSIELFSSNILMFYNGDRLRCVSRVRIPLPVKRGRSGVDQQHHMQVRILLPEME
ncbi:hypothetical protein [Pedobacter sp.]|uniref:hypothetical protein n=1 Tax=Pedobacter sp. TaxID=1411316 RepID=UPI002C619003|nr:hypothetical protein [Pedobacter sp.]HWW39700.1 hypothetical protein [Pedobacter sp.]